MFEEGLERLRFKGVWCFTQLISTWSLAREESIPPLIHPATAQHLIIHVRPAQPRYELVGSIESGDVRRVWGIPRRQDNVSRIRLLRYLYSWLHRGGASNLKKLEIRTDLMYGDRSRDINLPRDESARRLWFWKEERTISGNPEGTESNAEGVSALETFDFSALEPPREIRSSLFFFALELQGGPDTAVRLLLPDLHAQLSKEMTRLGIQILGGNDALGSRHAVSQSYVDSAEAGGFKDRYEFRRQ